MINKNRKARKLFIGFVRKKIHVEIIKSYSKLLLLISFIN